MWLKDLRKKEGLRQCDIADKANISISFYNQIENGKRRPSVEVAKSIAEILNFAWTMFYIRGN